MENYFIILLVIASLLLILSTYLAYKTVQKLKENLHSVHQDFHISAYLFYEMIIQRYSIKEKQKAVETVVDVGSILLEGIHNTIAELAFKVLEISSVSATKVHKARQAHENFSVNLYDFIRGTNKGIGQLTDDILGIRTDTNTKEDDKPTQ
jgi:cytochrome bd-type quinol oxidase subunit 2